MNRSKNIFSILAVFSLLFSLSLVSISQSRALDCASFTGQAPLIESPITEALPADGATQASEQVLTVIDIAPVNQVIFVNEPLPNLNCFTTSDPASVYLAPTCTAVDNVGIEIRTTQTPGTYTILCQGGGFVSGVSANYGSGTLTVKALPTPTNPSSTTTTSTPSQTPSTSISPTLTPATNPVVPPQTQASPSQLPIDVSVPLERTGSLENCSVFTAERPLPSDSTIDNGSTQSDSNPSELTLIPIDIKASDYRIYENMKLPTFDCTIADDPSKVVVAPVCSAFDGVRQLTNAPQPGLYLIQCQGGEFLPGYSPAFRSAALTVLSLPRVTVRPSQIPTPPSSTAPTPSSSASANTLPTPSPSPSISSAPTPRPTQTNKIAESVFSLNSIDGQTKSVKITLPSILVTNLVDVDVDRSSNSSFFSDYLIVSPIIKRSGTPLTRYSQPIAISVPAANSDLVPVYSSNSVVWKEIAQGGLDMPTSQEVGYLRKAAGEVVIYTRTSGFFGLKEKQVPLSLSIPDPRSRYNPTATIQAAFSGGSGSGEFTFSSLTPSTCAVTSTGLIELRSIGNCSVRLDKAADRRYLAASSNVLTLVIESGQTKSPAPTAKPSTNPSPKPQPLPTSAASQVQRDFVILIDPRIEVTSSKVQLKAGQKSSSVTLNKVLQISALSLEKSAQYALTLVLPTGSGVALIQKSFKDGILVIQPLQLLRKGNYSLLIQNLSNNLVTVINLKAS